MILNTEDDRALLLQIIDSSPVQGPMSAILELAECVSRLRKAIETATVVIDPALEAMTDR